MRKKQIKAPASRVFLFLALTAVLLLGGLAAEQGRRAEHYRQMVSTSYRRAFSSLSGELSEVDSSMRKLLYASDPELARSLCVNVFGKANAAQTALSELPFSDYELEKVSSFLARLGDYAYALARLPAEEAGDSVDFETLSALSDTATLLSQNLLEMEGALERGELSLEALGRSGAAGAPLPAGEEFQAMEKEFPEVPTLVYDGPFSQHPEEEELCALAGCEPVSQEEARAAAGDFFGLGETELGNCAPTEGKLPLYLFSSADGSCVVQMTRQGGKPLSLSRTRPAGPVALDEEAALAKAKDFLASRGFGPVRESYWTRYEDRILFNFAALEGDCVCYPDLVKVAVALDDGTILGFEDAGWLAHHRERSLPAPTVSEEEARSLLSPHLKLLAHELCLIPSPGGQELFCHEFKCENEAGDHYLVYVNAQTGREEKILCLIEDENGTLSL